MKWIYLLVILLLISSCENDSNKQSDTVDKIHITGEEKLVSNMSVSDTWKIHWQQKNIAITFDAKNETLMIGEIQITKWFPVSIPKSLNPFPELPTYVNSNVENYFFYTVQEDKDSILQKYRQIFQANKWKEIKPVWDIEWDQNFFQFEWTESKVDLIINEYIPENLHTLGLSGTFIEVYYY